MPEVNGVKYPYTPQGMKQAEEARNKLNQGPGFDFLPGWENRIPPMGTHGPISPTGPWSNAPDPIDSGAPETWNPLPGYDTSGLPIFNPPTPRYPITPAPVHEAPIPPLEAELMPMPPQIPLTTKDLNMPIPGTANTNQVPTFPNSMPLGKMPAPQPPQEPRFQIPKQDWNKSPRYVDPSKIGGIQ